MILTVYTPDLKKAVSDRVYNRCIKKNEERLASQTDKVRIEMTGRVVG